MAGMRFKLVESFETKMALILVILGIMLTAVVASFTQNYVTIADAKCELQCGMNTTESCPHRGGLPFISYVGFTSSILLILIGAYLLIFRKDSLTQVPSYKKNPKILNTLNKDEKLVFDMIIKSGGAMLQSEILDKTGFSKAKVSRVLDKLEAKALVERRRSGMSNLIILRR